MEGRRGFTEKPGMDISLTPELERMVVEKVESGLYSSPSEVVREALCLMRERDLARQQQLQELRRQIALGLAEADRGELLDGKEVFRELRA